jgi:hypothetical protein
MGNSRMKERGRKTGREGVGSRRGGDSVANGNSHLGQEASGGCQPVKRP